MRDYEKYNDDIKALFNQINPVTFKRRDCGRSFYAVLDRIELKLKYFDKFKDKVKNLEG